MYMTSRVNWIVSSCSVLTRNCCLYYIDVNVCGKHI